MFSYGNKSGNTCLPLNTTLFDCRTSLYEDSVVLRGGTLVSVILLISLSFSINLTVISSYFRTVPLHTPNNVHVVSLAFSDALVSAVSMPVTAVRMSGNQQSVTLNSNTNIIISFPVSFSERYFVLGGHSLTYSSTMCQYSIL